MKWSERQLKNSSHRQYYVTYANRGQPLPVPGAKQLGRGEASSGGENEVHYMELSAESSGQMILNS